MIYLDKEGSEEVRSEPWTFWKISWCSTSWATAIGPAAKDVIWIFIVVWCRRSQNDLLFVEPENWRIWRKDLKQEKFEINRQYLIKLMIVAYHSNRVNDCWRDAASDSLWSICSTADVAAVVTQWLSSCLLIKRSWVQIPVFSSSCFFYLNSRVECL